ncbi:chloride channel protein, CIC family [Nitrosomonas cryotolerans]|uniref:Chloride channel protein, CIC family n=1 Tax=Nitrosomonas cryotolerans ATCC 49181 TaxID=1131553 RepID=A0A1N6FWW2_9PROT|nr:chloride channel protein [Nitrosomonas cryotolerans]SFP92076.1 chloride channel protein, CIC family [Nitrosomonas cryotolerans]SIN99795.1 chloride channel protein, CIC family [Nitrosomonas cryotolerans ATCC 49181]
MWLLDLQRTPRLILICIVLGVIGALGAQVFLLLLQFFDTYVLTAIGGFQTIDVETAHATAKAPQPFTHWYWWMPVSTTLGGLAAGLLIYGLAPETEGHGTDATLIAFHRNNGRMRARVPFVKTLASAITIGTGGSGGREGPTAQIASGAGAIIAQLFKLPDDERRIVILIGMAAGLSAIFKSPLGTAIFAVEILYSRMTFEGAALIFTLISASVAYSITGMFSGFTPLFLLSESSRELIPLDLLWFSLLGVLAGVVGAMMPWIYYGVRDWFVALKVPRVIKPAIGGLAVGLIGIALPPITGGGYDYMQFVLQGGSGLTIGLLLLFTFGKILTLSLTVGSGGSGGVFGPTLYVGVMLGGAFASLLHMMHIEIDGGWLAVVGMAAIFAGTARVPIASMVMVIEMTGGFTLIMPTMLAVAIAFLVQLLLSRHAKYPTIYECQTSTPADSPIYHKAYYQAAAELLRRQQVYLDRDILDSQLQAALDSDEGIAMRMRQGRLYRLSIPPGSPVAGSEVRSLGLDKMGTLIVGVFRGESDIIPSGSTRLQVHDSLLVATTDESILKFRALIAPPQAEESPS